MASYHHHHHHYLLLLMIIFLFISDGNADLLHSTCKNTGEHNELCLQILTANPKSKAADAHGLAGIILEATEKAVTSTGEEVILLADRTLSQEDDLLQCIQDCEEEYEDAVQQLEQSRLSMDEREYHEVVMFIEAAMADVKACQESCVLVPGRKNVLSKQNKNVSQMCSIALTLAKLLQAEKEQHQL